MASTSRDTWGHANQPNLDPMVITLYHVDPPLAISSKYNTIKQSENNQHCIFHKRVEISKLHLT